MDLQPNQKGMVQHGVAEVHVNGVQYVRILESGADASVPSSAKSNEGEDGAVTLPGHYSCLLQHLPLLYYSTIVIHVLYFLLQGGGGEGEGEFGYGEEGHADVPLYAVVHEAY